MKKIGFVLLLGVLQVSIVQAVGIDLSKVKWKTVGKQKISNVLSVKFANCISQKTKQGEPILAEGKKNVFCVNPKNALGENDYKGTSQSGNHFYVEDSDAVAACESLNKKFPGVKEIHLPFIEEIDGMSEKKSLPLFEKGFSWTTTIDLALNVAQLFDELYSSGYATDRSSLQFVRCVGK